MAKLHSRIDIYVDDELVWENAMLVEDARRATLKVKKGNAFVAAYTATTYEGRQGTIMTWTGETQGQRVTIAAAARQPTGCSKCGGRR